MDLRWANNVKAVKMESAHVSEVCAERRKIIRGGRSHLHSQHAGREPVYTHSRQAVVGSG